MVTVAQLELTLGCNHSCIYCYNPEELKGSEELSDDQWLEIVEQLSAVPKIILTGGEPFLRKDLVFKILEQNPSVAVNTNLSLATQKDLDRLVENATSLMVSLPSNNREQYRRITGRDSFNKVVDNLTYLASNGLKPTINMVVTPETVDEVVPLGATLYALGLDKFYAEPVQSLKTDPLSVEQTVAVMDSLLKLKSLGMDVGMVRKLPFCIIPEDPKYNTFLTRRCIANEMLVIGPSGDYRSCMTNCSSELYLPKECEPCEILDQCGGDCKSVQDYSLIRTDRRRDIEQTISCHHACQAN
jgi:MoaA/NifB/PqqE/SkfB family radical SAM enzyme